MDDYYTSSAYLEDWADLLRDTDHRYLSERELRSLWPSVGVDRITGAATVVAMGREFQLDRRCTCGFC